MPALYLVVWQDPEQPGLYRGPANVGRPLPSDWRTQQTLRPLAAWQQLAGPGGHVFALACQNQQRTYTIAPVLESTAEVQYEL
jgi:hypothetical protein